MFKIVEDHEVKNVDLEYLKNKTPKELQQIYFNTSKKVEKNEQEIEGLK